MGDVDCLSHSSSECSDKKSSSDSLDWPRDSRDTTGARGKWQTEHKLSSDSGVGQGCVPADDLFTTSHSNNSLNDWKKSSDSVNKSTDSISLYDSSNVNNKSTDNSLSLIKSFDSLSINKSLDSLNITDTRNSRVSLGSTSYEWPIDNANDIEVVNRKTHKILMSSELQSYAKSSSVKKSKLREWKSRTNVSCDIDWNDLNDELSHANQDQINLSCDMLNRLSLNQDNLQCGASSSRSSESILKTEINHYKFSQLDKNTEAPVGFFSSYGNGLSAPNYHNGVAGSTTRGALVLHPSRDSICSSGIGHQEGGPSSPHTPITLKSSQHSLFSTPNSLSMTPNSSSLASDLLLDTPDSLTNPHLSSYNSLTATPNSLPGNCNAYNVTPKSLPHTPLSYCNTPNSLSNTTYPNNHTPYSSNTPNLYSNSDTVYSSSHNNSYSTPNPSFINSFYNTPDAYLEAPPSYSQYSYNPYNGDAYPGNNAGSTQQNSSYNTAQDQYTSPSQSRTSTTGEQTINYVLL